MRGTSPKRGHFTTFLSPLLHEPSSPSTHTPLLEFQQLPISKTPAHILGSFECVSQLVPRQIQQRLQGFDVGLVALDLDSDRQVRLVGRELTCTDHVSRITPLAEMGSDDDFCFVVDGR